MCFTAMHCRGRTMTVHHPTIDAQRGAIPGCVEAPDGLMVFDGVCNFCSAQVQLLLRLDTSGAIRFTAIQSPYGQYLSARFGIDPLDPSTFLFFDKGRALEKSDAAIAIIRRLPRPWRWLRALRVIPRPLRDAIYRCIARNRYRLLGRRETCLVPPAHVRARFIDQIPPETS
ncbi:thiol-disulfide oxidoreductase DCC family protein [Chelatococcus sp.]|uniref:thiol-disulfide oxidoreductase DCC family protein n=1 Tax=Chelatococcus sp. TaxID=1953771 RepID=UPI0025BE817F|nr:thiol-disulfide oxidoreductase DCC family protein [Chelatococcus sp.]